MSVPSAKNPELHIQLPRSAHLIDVSFCVTDREEFDRIALCAVLMDGTLTQRDGAYDCCEWRSGPVVFCVMLMDDEAGA